MEFGDTADWKSALQPGQAEALPNADPEHLSCAGRTFLALSHATQLTPPTLLMYTILGSDAGCGDRFDTPVGLA